MYTSSSEGTHILCMSFKHHWYIYLYIYMWQKYFQHMFNQRHVFSTLTNWRFATTLFKNRGSSVCIHIYICASHVCHHIINDVIYTLYAPWGDLNTISKIHVVDCMHRVNWICHSLSASTFYQDEGNMRLFRHMSLFCVNEHFRKWVWGCGRLPVLLKSVIGPSEAGRKEDSACTNTTCFTLMTGNCRSLIITKDGQCWLANNQYSKPSNPSQPPFNVLCASRLRQFYWFSPLLSLGSTRR